MSGLENTAFEIGLNTETAEWLNSQYSRMERGRRLLLDIAQGNKKMGYGQTAYNRSVYAAPPVGGLASSRPEV